MGDEEDNRKNQEMEDAKRPHKSIVDASQQREPIQTHSLRSHKSAVVSADAEAPVPAAPAAPPHASRSSSEHEPPAPPPKKVKHAKKKRAEHVERAGSKHTPSSSESSSSPEPRQ